jgi:hypothetical protein
MATAIEALSDFCCMLSGVKSAPSDPDHPDEWSPAKWADYDGSNTFTRTSRGAIDGDIEKIKRGLDYHERLNTHTFMYASQEGHLCVLKFLFEQHCPLDIWAFMMAIQNNHLDCLRFLCETCLTPENVANINKPCYPSEPWIVKVGDSYLFREASARILLQQRLYGVCSRHTDQSRRIMIDYMKAHTHISD